MRAGEGRVAVFRAVHADAGVWRACGVGDVPGRGTAVCEGEPRRVAEGCAERVAGSDKDIRLIAKYNLVMVKTYLKQDADSRL